MVTVSVVMATYNRPRALRLAVASVRAQTLTDWELIVVGDACADETAEAVAGFADPRIRFVNLPVRCGEQSGPNNVGCGLAGGRVLAFLNHDDLWWPDHLATGVAALDATGADIVFADLLVVGTKRNFVLGDPRGRGYQPGALVPCSAWVMRTAAARAVGPWRPARTLHAFPSQEWLFRAWWAGTDARFSLRWALRRFPARKVIRPTGALTVVHIPSARRPGLYRTDDVTEQERYAALIRAGGPRAIDVAAPEPSARRRWRWLASRPEELLARALARVGVAPMSTRMFLKHGGRPGRALAALRRRRGLEGGA